MDLRIVAEGLRSKGAEGVIRMQSRVVDPSWERLDCPYCGKVIYLDNQLRRTYHEAPACRRFLQLCAETNGNYQGETEVPVRDGR